MNSKKNSYKRISFLKKIFILSFLLSIPVIYIFYDDFIRSAKTVYYFDMDDSSQELLIPSGQNHPVLKIAGKVREITGIKNKALELEEQNRLTCLNNITCLKLDIDKGLSLILWIKIKSGDKKPFQQEIISLTQNYGDNFKKKSFYNVFDLATLNSQAKGYISGIFDGRYLYLIPIKNDLKYHGLVARYDTSKVFNQTNSWEIFDTEKINKAAKGYGGGVFDGQYIYLVPNYNDNTRSGLVVRFDTRKEFRNKSSWEIFDTTLLNDNSRGFWGGIFDGRYIYFVPHHHNKDYSGVITQYDTTSAFSSPDAWRITDITKFNSRAKGFLGGIYDGRYVYFIPNRTGVDIFSGLLGIYDTGKDLQSASAWQFFDIQKLNPQAKGFAGGVFDGRYIYLAPLFSDPVNFNGLSARYDTRLPLLSPLAWQFNNLSNLDQNAKGFIDIAFDGKNLYYIPFRNRYTESEEIMAGGLKSWCSADQTGGFSGTIARYKTGDDFSRNQSWSFFDLTSIDSTYKGFWGGAFDGRFLYYIPVKFACSILSSQIIRYDTVDTALSQIKLIVSPVFQSSFSSQNKSDLVLTGNILRQNISIYSGENIADNQWHQLALVIDGSSASLYVDGKQKKVKYPDQIKNKIGDFLLTVGNADRENTADFAIDEIQIYNHSLTIENINQLYLKFK